MIKLSFIENISEHKNSLELEAQRELKLEVDNRELNDNSLFIAIKGERFNPLEHLDKVVASGCHYVLYEKNTLSERDFLTYQDKIHFFEVEKLLDTIGKLGSEVARSFRERGGQILAISGSNGKTTTKEMTYYLASQLLGEQRVICTQKNNNNHLGVPFSLFQITAKVDFAIIELGSNAPGEIEYLCKILDPQYGITTNIGDTHLEFFETRNNVFLEEAVLKDYSSKIFFKNSDDEFLKNIKRELSTISFGFDGSSYKLQQTSSKRYLLNSLPLENKLITGKHNFINLGVSCLMISEIWKIELEQVLKQAQSFSPTNNRSQWLDIGDKKVFLDAYNANPSSMVAAIEGFFSEVAPIEPEQACLIIGDMNELGTKAELFHRELGEFVSQYNEQYCIFVGRHAEVCRSKCTLKNIIICSNYTEASIALTQLPKTVKYLFIKGSRSLQLERILDIKER